MKVNKSNFMKSVRFSSSLLIQDNIIFFMKLGKDDELLVKDITLDISLPKTSKNKFIFITKEIRDLLEESKRKELEVNLDDNYLKIENIKIELLDTVVQYGK